MTSNRRDRPYLVYYWLCVAVLEGTFIGIGLLSYDKNNIRLLLSCYLGSFLPYLAVLWLAPRVQPASWMIWVPGLIFRLTMLFAFPVFSEDIFRYLLEGKMQLNGINPYLTAPADPLTVPLRDDYFELINHPSISTIYPPLSELFFRLCMAISYNLYFFKGVLIGLDLALTALLYALVKAGRTPVYNLLLYVWHPLAVVEIAGNGHQDIIGILFLVGCLYFQQKKRLWGAAACLVGSFLSKLFPLVLFPLLLRQKNKWPYLLLGLLTVLFYLPFWSPDAHLFTGLIVYTQKWEANASIFFLFKRLLNHAWFSKALLGLVFVGIYLYVYRKIAAFDTAAFAVIGSFLILSPTLHPWYLLWIIPFVVLRSNHAWLWLTISAAAYYHALIGYFSRNVWQEALWIKCLIYIPFFALLVIAFVGEKKSDDV